MRNIKYDTNLGEMEISVEEAFIKLIARRHGIPSSSVSDHMVLQFFDLVSSTAIDRAVDGYVVSDGTNT